VRITDIQITSASGSYIAAEKGYFKDEGIEPQFLPVASAEQVTAIVSDSADVAGAAINAQLFNALARGLPIKMMADHGANLKDASAGGLAVRKDLVDSGAYTGAADLKGRKFAVGAQPKTSTADIALSRWLESQAGLTEDDLDTTIIGLPDMIAAFASKNIDASYWQEPFTTIALDQGLIVRGPIAYEMYPEQQIAVLVFGKKLADNRDLSLRYLRAYTRGVRDYVKGLIQKDPKTMAEVVPILIKHTTVKDPALFQKAIPSGLKADPVPNVKSITDDLGWFVKAGQVQQQFDLGPYLDAALVQEAVQQVGPAA
jgi:NitT/TauT family transport system substrate-binding protein